MRKYFQITIVLIIFFALVFLRKLTGEDLETIVNNNIFSPTLSLTITITPSPVLIDTNSVGDVISPVNNLPTVIPTQLPRGKYKDGAFIGAVEDAYYGNMQVKAIINEGKLIDIVFLQFPNHNRTSIRVNGQALPILKAEAIKAQSEDVDMVSGASFSSPAFKKSLASALSQAK